MSSSIYHLFLSHSLLSLLISFYSYPFFYLAASFQAFLCVVSIFICFRSLASLLISSHLISSLSSQHFTHPVTSLIYMLSFAVISSHLFSFISMFISCDIFFGHLFIFIYLLSFSIISTHLLNRILHSSCNIFPLLLFVFHLSLSPLILYHLYSSLLNRIATYFL